MLFTKNQFILLRQAYLDGENITELITSWNIPVDLEAITFIYELQSGTYTKEAQQNANIIELRSQEISSLLKDFIETDFKILDCGTGEATTFIPILHKLKIDSAYGIDTSISRLTYAQKNSQKVGINLNLAVAEIAHLPFQSNSMDAILTSHGLEPNGGQEAVMLKELGRVAKKYLFLVEPDFNIATIEQQERMIKLNYIQKLEEAIKFCGYNLLEKIPLLQNSNPKNCASLFVIELGNLSQKSYEDYSISPDWVDPIFLDPLEMHEGGFVNQHGLWYPIIRGIPLLKRSNTQYLLNPAN